MNFRYYAKDRIDDGMKQLEEHKISTWREVFNKDGNLKSFISIDPSERSNFLIKFVFFKLTCYFKDFKYVIKI